MRLPSVVNILCKTVTSHPARRIALILLCAPYLTSGVHKLVDFDAGIAEMANYGLTPSAPYAAVTIVIQILFSILVITGFCRWLGALGLAAFTIAASLVADPFWHTTSARFFAGLQAFVEHIALAGGFLLVAWYALHKYRNRGRDDWE
ncbi:DoxX family protein [Rhizobium sp. S152]|uniref:DoxX family protein n=1 Tax=Rhizobium sp. S152 TaxID=3055038 RepID=UPI0025A9766B|nr:DoxX family protein [Rhizobium sp. S152]MDM9627817.1 DoxX family protein [Rhizobium sp. S152]